MLRQFAALFVALCLGFAPHPAFAVLKGSGSPTAGQIAASQSGEDSLTAFAGGGQTNATALSATVTNHRVTTVATAADSVKLPAATVGQAHYVRNDGAASMQVFGQATETIDGVASATGVAQAAGTGVWYISTTAAKWTRSAVYNPANVAITGGTIAGTTLSATAPNSAVETVLYMGGVPLISLSSGSVAANGAISGITALTFAYPSAYCYFPANILATVKAAGYYYCTFSTTTAGIAFLDALPATGVATIPASPTAVTDGKGAFTGDTGEEFGPTITVPALGANSVLVFRIYENMTNNANAKTTRVRLSGQAGTVFISEASASKVRVGYIAFIQNTGATGKQFSGVYATTGGNVTTEILGTIDTSVSTTAVLSLQKATATDNIVLMPPLVTLAY